MNISAVIISAAEILRDADVVESRREALSLLAFVLRKEDVFLIAHPEYELSESEAATFENLLHRRAGHEPYQYIVGHKVFYGLEFEVSPGVLIPRPETEILVEAAISTISIRDRPTFYEIGVGSGCISVSILYNVASARAVGVDISDAALAVAVGNAERHDVVDRLTLRKVDIFDGVSDKFDLIVSNPPYIPAGGIAGLHPEVRDFEPHKALSGGGDGLDIIKRIVRESPEHLVSPGVLLMEIGFDQSAAVRELFDLSVWRPLTFLPDFQGIPRVLKAVVRV